jgi:imidazolonepropionase-like amidohydrolase
MKKWYLWLLLAIVAVLATLPWVCDREELRLEETNRQELAGSARFATRRFLDDIRRGDAPADEITAQVPLATKEAGLVQGIFARIAGAVSSLTLAAAPAQTADWLILSNFTLIDGTGAPARSVEKLQIRDGVIVAIDGEGDDAPPAESDAVVSVDLGGGFVMPGLVDTHVHVGRFPKARAEAERILKAAVRGGVASVRDLGGDARALAEAERAMMRGEFVGATLTHSALFGGESLFAQDGRLADHAIGFAPGTAPWSKAVTEASDLRLAVAEAKGAGATIAKVYGNLDARLAGRLIAEAERQGLKTAAHATVFPAGPSALVAAGVDSLSHAPYLVWEGARSIPADYEARTRGPWAEIPSDHPKLLALYELMAERGVFLDATLFVYRDMAKYSPAVDADWTGAAFSWAMQAVRVAHERGVRITTGTDWFEPRSEAELPHTHEELALLVEAGLSPMEAIVAGTRNGAEAMGVGATRGTIAVGKAADLLVLDANPLADIRNTTKLRFVVKDGRIVTRD